MIFLLKHWKAIAGLILLAAVWGHGYHTKGLACAANEANERARAEQVIAEFAKAERDAIAAAMHAERERRKAVDEAAAAYERGKTDAQDRAGRIAADLAADNARLRNHWQGCQATSRLSADAGAAAVADEQDRLRRESLQRVLGWVGELQAQRDALIDGWREAAK